MVNLKIIGYKWHSKFSAVRIKHHQARWPEIPSWEEASVNSFLSSCMWLHTYTSMFLHTDPSTALYPDALTGSLPSARKVFPLVASLYTGTVDEKMVCWYPHSSAFLSVPLLECPSHLGICLGNCYNKENTKYNFTCNFITTTNYSSNSI